MSSTSDCGDCFGEAWEGCLVVGAFYRFVLPIAIGYYFIGIFVVALDYFHSLWPVNISELMIIPRSVINRANYGQLGLV